MHKSLNQQLNRIRIVASGSIFRRIINNPINYLTAIGHREIIYPINQKPLHLSANLFWGDQLKVALPSGVDMYILGAKSDESEIRLTRFLINNLKPGNTFIDVGAHFGYYTKLAAHLIGQDGNVIAIEPSNLAFELLKMNTKLDSNIEIHNALIGRKSDQVSFYEFPTKYAEYNSIDIDQYQHTNWFNESLVTHTRRRTLALDDLIKGTINKIDFIKLDVEGAEHEVVLGAQNIIQSNHPIIGMEYVHYRRSNSSHIAAVKQLRDLGYKSYRILDSGDLEEEWDLDKSLTKRNLDSDNFIFNH